MTKKELDFHQFWLFDGQRLTFEHYHRFFTPAMAFICVNLSFNKWANSLQHGRLSSSIIRLSQRSPRIST
jgi:hypothetical protein